MTKASDVEVALDRLKWELAVHIFEENTKQLSQLVGAKYDPSQPRDDRGRWTDTGADQSTGNEGADPRKILELARQWFLAGTRASFSRCTELCYPLLERFQPPGVDYNYWDFQRCMNACLGRNR